MRLQWFLIAQMAGVELAVLAGDKMPLFAIYQAIYSGAFRQSQLAVHMARTDNTIERLFTPDTLSRFMFVPSSVEVDRAQVLRPLLVASGLALLGRQE